MGEISVAGCALTAAITVMAMIGAVIRRKSRLVESGGGHNPWL